ncbi:MAG: ferritin-like domain-containing protein [Myxococcota bacterium]
MSRKVELSHGEPAALRLRTALAERPPSRTGVKRVAPIKTKDPSAARQFWSERAWSEYAAVPAMAQTMLAIVRDRGSLDVLDTLAIIASDEVRHTEMSKNLADAFGGYVEEVPDNSGYNPLLLAEPYDMAAPFWALSNGCVSETVSLEMMRARLPHTTHPAVRPILQRIMKDESMHARLSWLLAETIFPRLDPDQKEEIADYARELFAVMPRTFATKELPPGERRSARKVRNAVAKAGLGAAPPDEEDAAFYHVRDDIILPRLRKLGIPL